MNGGVRLSDVLPEAGPPGTAMPVGPGLSGPGGYGETVSEPEVPAIVAFLGARWDEQEEDVQESRSLIPGELHWSMPDWLDRIYLLADIAAKRRILAEHAPVLCTVEWDHDQTGKGEALCCPRCQNAEHSDWNPPVGQVLGLPDDFVTWYVLAPCKTLRLLTAPFAAHPDFDPAWAVQ